MNVILIMSLIMILITLGIAYVTYNLANSEEAKIINEVQIKYPNTLNY